MTDQKLCAHCGRSFTATHRAQIYCGPGCYQAASQRRRKRHGDALTRGARRWMAKRAR